MKKILIFYASYGGGHLSAAKSIKAYIDENYKDYETEMIDCVEYISKALDKVTTGVYKEFAKKAPWAWGKVYYKSQEGFIAKVSTTSNKIMAVKMAKLFREYNPDIVISTHPFGSQMTAYLKKKQKTNCKLITILTDFKSHDQWLIGSEHTDFFFVSNDLMRQSLIDSGISENKVFATGIPISKRFMEKFDKEEIFKEFSLKPNKQTILFFGGGEYGLGKQKTISILNSLAASSYDIQIIAIAGKNKKLKKTFEDIVSKYKREDTIKVLPFTNKVPELMHIANLVITKPGGLTTSESLACNLPLIVINPIPGQEEENAEFLEKAGAAIWIKKNSNPDDIFKFIFENESILEKMSKNSTIIAKPNSTKDICDICLK